MIPEDYEYRVQIYLNKPKKIEEETDKKDYCKRTDGKIVCREPTSLYFNDTLDSSEVWSMLAVTSNEKHGISVSGDHIEGKHVSYPTHKVMSKHFKEICKDINENSQLLDEFVKLNNEEKYKDTIDYTVSNKNDSKLVLLNDCFGEPSPQEYARSLKRWAGDLSNEFKTENNELLKQIEKLDSHSRITDKNLEDALKTAVYLHNNNEIQNKISTNNYQPNRTSN
ncbi:MAG: hypothetical protein ABEK17_00525 [Candidatus Aenigmatarchaeota archaeon]